MSIEENPRGSGFLYGLYQKRLRRELAVEALPHHVAMIIDGNRRWAKQRLLGTAAHGHRAGAAKMREFLEYDGSKPILMECVVSNREHVFPMVVAGKALHEQLLHPKLREATEKQS